MRFFIFASLVIGILTLLFSCKSTSTQAPQSFCDTVCLKDSLKFSGNDVKRIFLTISLSIGLVGGMLGLLFGFLLSMGINHIPFETAALPTVKTYPVNYNPAFYIVGILFSLLTTYLAGLLPARKAGKVDPVIIIRGK